MAAVPYHIVRRGKSKVWYVWWLHGGKKVWKRILTPDGELVTGTTPRKAVMSHAATVYTQTLATPPPACPPTGTQRKVKAAIETHDDLFRAYRRGREHEWDCLTVKQYENWFAGQRAFFGAAANVRDVSVQEAEEFRNWLLLKKGLASRTVTERLAFTRRVFQ